MLLLISSCSNDWSAANHQFEQKYSLRNGKVFELIKPVYITQSMVAYPSPKQQNYDYIKLRPGTRFEAIKVNKKGSYTNGYFYVPVGKIISAGENQGLEFSFDRLLVDHSGRAYTDPYVKAIK